MIYTKATDSEHRVHLESEIISASWISGRAAAGGVARLELVTQFVGQGSPVKITVKKESGSVIARLDARVRDNALEMDVPIPEEIALDDFVYYEAHLTGCGIRAESDRIPAAPAIWFANMRWSAPEARRGDILTLSADAHGLRNGEEAAVVIHEHDEDGAHDRITEIPARVEDGKVEVRWEYEYHEDTEEIPTQEEMERYGGSYNPPEYFFTIRVEGVEHGTDQESGLLRFKDCLEIECTEIDGQPAAGRAVRVTLPDGSEREERLDEDGRLRLEGIPPGACAFVVLPEDDGE